MTTGRKAPGLILGDAVSGRQSHKPTQLHFPCNKRTGKFLFLQDRSLATPHPDTRQGHVASSFLSTNHEHVQNSHVRHLCSHCLGPWDGSDHISILWPGIRYFQDARQTQHSSWLIRAPHHDSTGISGMHTHCGAGDVHIQQHPPLTAHRSAHTPYENLRPPISSPLQ